MDFLPKITPLSDYQRLSTRPVLLLGSMQSTQRLFPIIISWQYFSWVDDKLSSSTGAGGTYELSFQGWLVYIGTFLA